MNKKEKAQRGITLIALVITIIVMLILVAVTISMAVKGGLFNYAGKATGETNNAIREEQQLASGKITIDNKIYNSIDEYLNGETEDSTLKPMILKLNVEEDTGVGIGIYRPEYYNSDEEGNEIVTELPDNTDVTIDWGDGEVEHYTSSDLIYVDDGTTYYVEHEYSEANDDVTVTITGKCNAIELTGMVGAFKEIEAWGNTETYYYNFSGTGLVSIPAPEKNTFKNVISFEETFRECSSLTSLPEGLFANCTSVKSFSYTFYGCTGLTSLPDNLFANCTSVTDFGSTFWYCTGLTSIPRHLFDDCQNVSDFQCTFYGCTNLTGEALPLWERIQNPDEDGYGIPNGYACYLDCEKLTNYDSIPLFWRESLE